MGKKKIIAAITAVSLSVGLVGFATACDGESGDEHRHTYSQSWSVSDTEHWHDATCEHVGKVDKDRAAHIDEDGSVRRRSCTMSKRTANASPTGSGTFHAGFWQIHCGPSFSGRCAGRAIRG